jgi:hypothetical protein
MIQCGLAFGRNYCLQLQGRKGNLKMGTVSSPGILTFRLPTCKTRSIVSNRIAFIAVRFTECHCGDKVNMTARAFFVGSVTSSRCSLYAYPLTSVSEFTSLNYLQTGKRIVYYCICSLHLDHSVQSFAVVLHQNTGSYSYKCLSRNGGHVLSNQKRVNLSCLSQLLCCYFQ